jgi:hypothetical protein
MGVRAKSCWVAFVWCSLADCGPPRSRLVAGLQTAPDSVDAGAADADAAAARVPANDAGRAGAGGAPVMAAAGGESGFPGLPRDEVQPLPVDDPPRHEPADASGPTDAAEPADAAPARPRPTAAPRWEFEQSASDWADFGRDLAPNDTPKTPPRLSSDRAFGGRSSLAYDLSTTGSDDPRYLAVMNDGVVDRIGPLRGHDLLFFELWLPPDHRVRMVQAFVLGYGVPWLSTNNFMGQPLQAGGWTTFVVPIPAAYQKPETLPMAIGVQLWTDGAWHGTVHLDSVVVQ